MAGRVESDVMLVGSMPYDDAGEVFRRAGRALRGHVSFLPDGEVKERTNWVGMLPQYVYSLQDGLEEVNVPPGRTLVQPDREGEKPPMEELPGIWTFRVKPGAEARFDDLRYGTFALDSYRTFRSLRDEGAVEAGVRFQLCLPSPCSAIDWAFEEPGQWPALYAAYRDGIRRELDKVLTEVPADDLVVQWDAAWEFVDLGIGDKRLFSFFPRMTQEEKAVRYIEQLDGLGQGIPDETQLGYHWCYGTWGGWPMVAMEDLALCVRMSNEAVARTGRRVDYVHMPVPRRPDEGFFAPLAGLDIGETAVFLGMVHHTDGIEDFRRRRDLARRYLPRFGVAGVCGYGRVDQSELDHVLEVHAACAAEL
jgi:hypothetical protein